MDARTGRCRRRRILEYRGSAGDGLANQGWKDSGDGVRWSDGTIAERPLALCEVQGYAYEAAIGGAAILEAFGEDPATIRKWAAELRERFRAEFWLDDAHGRYPAIALDGAKRPVSGPASNMAHLLGTGLLNGDEAELVAKQLGNAALNSGYGLRTLSARVGGFSPFSYHCDSVWPHDTAIAVLGLDAEGLHEQARRWPKDWCAPVRTSGTGCPSCSAEPTARQVMRCRPTPLPVARKPGQPPVP